MEINNNPAERPRKAERPKKSKEETVKNLKIIWDSFGPEGQNLTWPEFMNQMLELQDPKKMFSDLDDMQLAKARERMNRMRIEKAIG